MATKAKYEVKIKKDEGGYSGAENVQCSTSNIERRMTQAAVSDRRLKFSSFLIRERGENGCSA
jgi:hypothetical protein